MPRYTISIPVNSSLEVSVVAATKEDAINQISAADAQVLANRSWPAEPDGDCLDMHPEHWLVEDAAED